MALIHRWTFTDLNDSVGDVDFVGLTGADRDVLCTGTIFGNENYPYITDYVAGLGEGYTRGKSVYDADGLVEDTSGAVSILFKTVSIIQGYMLNFIRTGIGTTMAIRTAYNNADIVSEADTTLVDASEYTLGTWNHLVINFTYGAGADVYLNGSFLRHIADNIYIPNGFLRLNGGAYQETTYLGSYCGGAELSDIRLYDEPLTAGEITTLYNSYGTRDTVWKFYAKGEDHGGLFPFTANLEYNEQTDVQIENLGGSNIFKYNVTGDQCIVGKYACLPANTEFWAYYDLYFPAGMVADTHTIGSDVKIFSANFHNYTFYITFQYDDSDTNELVYTYRAMINNGGQSQLMRNFLVTRDTWHKCEMYYNYGTGSSDGILQFWFDDELLIDIDDASYSAQISELLLGTINGLHLLPPGEWYNTKNLWISTERYASGTSQFAPLLSNNFNNILLKSILL